MSEAFEEFNKSVEPRFRHFAIFQSFISLPQVREAYEELYNDFLREEWPSKYTKPVPHRISALVYLCEINPELFSYSKPSPEKRMWTYEGHFARFSIRLQAIRRMVFGLEGNVLMSANRLSMVRSDIELAVLMYKMGQAPSLFVPSSR